VIQVAFALDLHGCVGAAHALDGSHTARKRMARFRRAHTSAIFESEWLTLSKHSVLSEQGEPLPFPVYTLDMGDWVNVVALTPGEPRSVIFVRQHRFGTEQRSLEIPGGLIDPGESPLHAAQRELEEETGYTSNDWSALSWTYPNPALQANKLFMFVARDCVKTSEVRLDPLEDCEVELVKYSELPHRLARGEIRHALVLLALYELLLADCGVKVSAP
jgi:8-oxo-dGTP pyrophosphatase MutT (NUDIX family)